MTEFARTEITGNRGGIGVLSDENFALLHGSSNVGLARSIAKYMGIRAENPTSRFTDDEIGVQIRRNLRDRDVVIAQSTVSAEAIMELIIMTDAARRGSARSITAVIPYYGYGRQERKDKPRRPISAALLAQIYEFAGIHRIVTADIHEPATAGSVRIPWDELFASSAFLPIIEAWNLPDLAIVAPDEGGGHRAEFYRNRLQCYMATVYKERTLAGAKALGLNGNVKGKHCVVIDDIIASFQSLTECEQLLRQRGALSVRAMATHAVLTPGASMRMMNSSFDHIVFTDTIHQSPVYDMPSMRGKFTRVSAAPLIGEAIMRNQGRGSLSDLIANGVQLPIVRPNGEPIL